MSSADVNGHLREAELVIAAEEVYQTRQAEVIGRIEKKLLCGLIFERIPVVLDALLGGTCQLSGNQAKSDLMPAELPNANLPGDAPPSSSQRHMLPSSDQRRSCRSTSWICCFPEPW